MYDKREAILQKLFSLLLTVDGPLVIDGVPSVFRNRGEVPETKMPALVLLDGREEIRVSTSGKGGIFAATIFTLNPQIFIVLKPTEDLNNAGIGEELSSWRMRVLKVITTDEELLAMLGSNGEINYLGHETDMQAGSAILGQMQIILSLNYVLNPKDYV